MMLKQIIRGQIKAGEVVKLNFSPQVNALDACRLVAAIEAEPRERLLQMISKRSRSTRSI